MSILTLNLTERQRRHETGDTGVLDGALFDDRDELLERSAFEVHPYELWSENRRGVRLAGVGPDLEGLGRQLLSHVGVPSDEGPGGLRQRLQPVQGGLIELIGPGRCDPEATVTFLDVAGAGRGYTAHGGGPEEQNRVSDAFGQSEGPRRSLQRLVEQGRHQKRERHVVQNPHRGCVVPGRLGEGDGLIGEGTAALEWGSVGEFLAQIGQYERPVGVAGRETFERGLQDGDLVGIDDTEDAEEATIVGERGGHESVRVTEVGRSVSSVEERVAKRRVTRLALRGAEPDGQVDAEDRIRVGGLGVEVEGLGVVAKGVGRG